MNCCECKDKRIKNGVVMARKNNCIPNIYDFVVPFARKVHLPVDYIIYHLACSACAS